MTPRPGSPCRRRGAGLGPPPGQAVRRRRRSTTSKSFVVKPTARSGFLDHESSKPETARPRGRRRCSPRVDADKGGVAGRLRLDDGRRPRQARQRCTVARRDRVRRRRPPPADDPFVRHHAAATGLLDGLVDLASRAPSAGKTQGWHLVVLEGDETARFWDITLPPMRRGAVPVEASARRAGDRCCRSPIPRRTSSATPSPTRPPPVSGRAPTPGRRRTGRSTRRCR